MPVVDLPPAVGRYQLSFFREITLREWVGQGPHAAVHLLLVDSAALAESHHGQLRERRSAILRALAEAPLKGLLDPLGCGVEELGPARFVWSAAASPGVGATRWVASVRSATELAECLAGLHRAGLAHGGLSRSCLWLRADGSTALAPWRSGANAPDAATPIESDILAFGELIRESPELHELSRRCRNGGPDRPRTGSDLVHALTGPPQPATSPRTSFRLGTR